MKSILVFAVCASLTAACQSGNVLGPSSTTKGQVISDDFYGPETRFIPVAGVRVEVVDGWENGRFSITDSDGRYDLGTLTQNARVLLTKDGWEPSHSWAPQGGWYVMSQEPHVMWGTVSVRNTSTRLEGVRIEILDGPNAGKVTHTDSTGAYRFIDLVTSPRFSVELSKTSYLTSRGFIDHFDVCEWKAQSCGLRKNLQWTFVMDGAGEGK